jgi:dienelactone hydrolase
MNKETMMDFKEIAAKYNATIEAPPEGISGISVLLGGAFVDVSEYETTRKVLLGEKQQLVIAFNKLTPWLLVYGKKHTRMAEDVRDAVSDVVAEVRKAEKYEGFSDKYSVVGHSMGGKVALLVAAKFDVERVLAVVALDPVDCCLREIVNRRVNMENAKAKIHLTSAGADGWGIPKCGNAEAIRAAYPGKMTSFTPHPDAGHFAYTDHGGGLPSFAPGINRGDPEANKSAHEGAHKLIKAKI